ncbi:MAG: hypothetical protein MUP40_00040 [Actinobacteria bacterium]|nr:hypothetical protein [Actinomycetota bacterium]
MTAVLPGLENPALKVFDPLTGEIHAKNLMGEPVEREGRVLIPVNKVSVKGFSLRMPGKAGDAISKLPVFNREAKVSKHLVGHIVVEPTGVRWRPRVNIAKLALTLLPMLISLVVIVKRRA